MKHVICNDISYIFTCFYFSIIRSLAFMAGPDPLFPPGEYAVFVYCRFLVSAVAPLFAAMAFLAAVMVILTPLLYLEFHPFVNSLIFIHFWFSCMDYHSFWIEALCFTRSFW